MNRKIIVSLSIIALLSIYVIIANMKESSDIPEMPEWEGSADEIVIIRPDETINIFNKDGKWVVSDKAYPADLQTVTDLEKRFKEIRIVDLISRKGFLNKYDLTPDKYLEVMIKMDGKIFRKFMIGKKSSTNRHTFMRIDDKPEIYMAEGTFDLYRKKSVEDFRNKEIFKISKDAILNFEVNHRGRIFAFSKIKGKKNKDKNSEGESQKKGALKAEVTRWVLKGFERVELDNNRVSSLLSAFDPLRASSFPEIKKEMLNRYICLVTIKAFDKEVTLTIFKRGDKYLATSSESPYVFGLDGWRAERFLIKSIDKFKKKD